MLPLLSVAGALAYAALVVAYVLWYPRMKRVWLFLLPVVLFVPGRSLSSYLIDFFPAAMVAVLTVAGPVTSGTDHPMRVRPWRSRVAVAVPVAAAVAVAMVAFTSAPLQLSVEGFRTSNATQRLDSITVLVHNRSGHSLTPHFMVTISGSHPNGFWTLAPARDPVVLGPGQSATVTIRPNAYTWSPARGGYWLVEAYTTSPSALSTSPLQFWRLGKAQ